MEIVARNPPLSGTRGVCAVVARGNSRWTDRHRTPTPRGSHYLLYAGLCCCATAGRRAGMDRGPGGRGAGRLTIEHLKRRFVRAGSGVRLVAGSGSSTACSRLAWSPWPVRRAEALDPAPAGGESSGTGLGRAGVGDDGAGTLKKTNCSLIGRSIDPAPGQRRIRSLFAPRTCPSSGGLHG